MAKTKAAEVPAAIAEQAPRNYEIVGLQMADHMPIWFVGREYDLANLTDAEVELLLRFPEQVPYLKKKLDVSQASV